MIRAIDLFAGAGGFTTGALEAGLDVVWAANHWRAAVDAHAVNHPGVPHSCQDLLQADWRLVPDHEVLLASPACQGHSQAGQPGRWRPGVLSRQQMDRNTAWAVIGCAEIKRPPLVLVENVADFLRWPLFPAWQSALEILGYAVTTSLFDAADWGTPQNRRRAIVTASLDGPVDLVSPARAHRGFGPLVDWTAGAWRSLSEARGPGVAVRVRAARERGLVGRFLTHHVTGHRGREFDRPIGCVTTKDQWAAVRADDTYRSLSLAELRRAMDFSDGYALPAHRATAIRMLGNAIPRRFAAGICGQAVAGVARLAA